MHDLIKIHMNDGEQVVSARELHLFLEVSTPFRKWIERMLEYGFEENADFTRADIFVRGNEAKDYALTLDCAKEISMLQRNEKGKQARKYFIEVEKRAREMNISLSPAEQLLKNAELLVEQEKKLAEHDHRIKELESKNTTRPDYFTVAGFGSLNGIQVNIKLASRLGREATRLCKERGLIMDECPDPRFGKVKMYPHEVLEEVFNSVILR